MPREEGWLQRQFDSVTEDIKTWPIWMREANGLWTEQDERDWKRRKALVKAVEEGAKEWLRHGETGYGVDALAKDALQLARLLNREIARMEKHRGRENE